MSALNKFKIEEKTMKQTSTETRLALLEQSIGYIHEALNRIEEKVTMIHKEHWSQFRWLLLFIIAFCGSPFLLNLIQHLHILSK